MSIVVGHSLSLTLNHPVYCITKGERQPSKTIPSAHYFPCDIMDYQPHYTTPIGKLALGVEV